MGCSPNGVDRINSFALVSYLPGAIGQFLDALRKELVNTCIARSHVTLLPPRTLGGSADAAQLEVESILQDFSSFEIELGRISIFPVTQVIYLELAKGRRELEAMHDAFNTGGLYFNEPYEYHPHVTLAQELPPEYVDWAFALAEQRWADYAYSRRFPMDQVTFVQNTSLNRWVDLVHYPLPQPVGRS